MRKRRLKGRGPTQPGGYYYLYSVTTYEREDGTLGEIESAQPISFDGERWSLAASENNEELHQREDAFVAQMFESFQKAGFVITTVTLGDKRQ